MKRFLLLLIGIISFYQSQAQWVACNSGTTANLNSICFADSLNGICSGGSGAILRTTDGGNNWNIALDFPGAVIYKSLYCSNTLHSYAGKGNVFWDAYSTDKGATWKIDTITGAYSELPTCHNGILYSVIYVSNSNHEIIKLGTPNTLAGRNLLPYAVDNNYIYGYTSNNITFFKRTFAGVTVDSVNRFSGYFTGSSFSGIVMKVFGDTVITCTTYPSAIETSFDGGTNWVNYHPAHVPGLPLQPNVIISGKSIIGTSTFKQILRSDNSGASFTGQGYMTKKIYDFYFLDDQVGWLCGDSGMIYRTKTGGYPLGTGAVQPQKKGLQLYPNPASTSLTVEGITAGSKISVLSLDGRLLQVPIALHNTTAEIEIGALPAGTYFIEVSGKEGAKSVGTWVKH